MLPLKVLLFAAAGLASGVASGLFGIGGGTLRIPIFFYLLPWLGVEHAVLMHVSLGTSMALVIPSAIGATLKQRAAGNLDVSYYRSWAVAIFVGVLLGIFILPHASTEVLTAIFACFLLVVTLYMSFVPETWTIGHGPPRGALEAVIAAAIGCLAFLTGTAGGTLTTPTLRAFGMPLRHAIAIASATGLVTGIVGGAGAVVQGWGVPGRPVYSLGYVDVVIFCAMMPTILIGAPLGVRLSQRLSKVWLRRAYIALLVVIAVDMFRRLLAVVSW